MISRLINIKSVWYLLPFLLVLATKAEAQAYRTSLPAIEILQTDSNSVYRTAKTGKDKPVVLLLFHTTCEHCQQQARDMVAQKKDLEKVKLIMISTEPLYLIKKFYQQYGLSQIRDLVIGKDAKIATPKMFMYESFPFCAVYGKNHRFIQAWERNFNTASFLVALKNKGEIK